MKQKKLLRTIAVAAAVLVAVVSVGLIQRSSTPQTATIQFFSNNSAGYACFLNYSDLEIGGPICMSDVPSLNLPSSDGARWELLNCILPIRHGLKPDLVGSHEQYSDHGLGPV